MFQDNLQAQRFELKYLVTEDVAVALREFLGSYLELDENSIGKPDNSYPNHSIYLDSENLTLYWDVINGNKNRYKLRLRYYDEDPAAPVFFEIKRRSNDAILKQRGPVRREVVAALLAGQLPAPEDLLSDNPKHLVAVQRFCQLMMDLRAAPKTHVAYLREAWVSRADNSARVTLDRDVCSTPHNTADLPIHIENPVMPWRGKVILELKFTGRYPNWFRELTQIFGVMQTGVAKYAEGVALVDERRLSPGFAPLESEDLVEKFLSRRRSTRPDRTE
jgi:hypothetical protein